MLAGTARFCFNLFGFYFADSACTAIGLPSVTHSLVTTTFFACSKDGTSCINTFHTENGQPLRCVARTARICFNLFGFTLQILPAQQLVCPLHLKFPAACPRSHIPWSQRLFSPAPKITRFPYRKQAAPAMCCKNCLYLFQSVCILLCGFCLHGNWLALCI
mgnify:CR=1 FL=1